MSLEFFDRDNRPKLISTDFVMFRFVPEEDGRVRVDYVIEGALDDWTPLFHFSQEDFFIMSCNKFKHDTIETFGLIVADQSDIAEKLTDSIRVQAQEEVDTENDIV